MKVIQTAIIGLWPWHQRLGVPRRDWGYRLPKHLFLLRLGKGAGNTEKPKPSLKSLFKLCTSITQLWFTLICFAFCTFEVYLGFWSYIFCILLNRGTMVAHALHLFTHKTMSPCSAVTQPTASTQQINLTFQNSVCLNEPPSSDSFRARRIPSSINLPFDGAKIKKYTKFVC